jgi:serine/threonine protein kinase
MSHPSDPEKTVDEAPRQDSAVDNFGSRSDGVAAADRMELREEIARDGMGAVLKARDADIGRDVAVKILLADAHDQPHLSRRFLEEARITGRLQHPGVVPVYALGRLPDGRPYFAMKLVKGRTLGELLAERTDPTADRPRFLHVFEQVCQTLAYAHAHGVIHRDLKPSNVMVGAFGEVQVMDWGLAKVLTRDDTAKEPTEVVSMIRTPREDSDTGEDGS